MHPVVSASTLKLLTAIRGLSEFADTEDPPTVEDILENDMQLALQGMIEKRNRAQEDLKLTQAKLKETENQLGQTTNAWQNIIAECDQIQKQRDAAQKEYQQAVASTAKATTDRKQAESESARIRSKTAQTETKLAEIQNELHEFSQSRDRQEADLEQIAAQQTNASADLAATQRELQHAEQQKAQLQARETQVENAWREVQDQSTYWQKKEKTVARQQRHLVWHRFAVGLITIVLVVYVGILWWLTGGKWPTPASLTDTEESSTVLSTPLLDASAKQKALQSEIDILQQMLSDQESEIVTLQQTLADQETELVDSKNSLQILQQDLQQARVDLQQVESATRSEAVNPALTPEPVRISAARVNPDIAAPYANLRQEPAIQSVVSATAAPGTQVTVTACVTGPGPEPNSNGRWYQLDSGLWIWGELLVDIQADLFENCL